MRIYYRDLVPAAIHPMTGEVITAGDHPSIASDLCDELRENGDLPEFRRVYDETTMGYQHRPSGRFIPIELTNITCSLDIRAFPDRYVEVTNQTGEKEDG